MRTSSEIDAEMETLGRPRPELGSIGSIVRGLNAAKEWDAANPIAAARWQALREELEAAQREEKARDRERQHAERLERRLASRLDEAGLGSRQRDAAMSPKDTEALKAARQWYQGQKAWLLLCGGVGAGKSVAAGWCVVEVVKGGGTASQRKSQELARLSGFESGAVELERLKHIDLLVVDDVGAENVSEWGRAVLFELLDARHEERLRTVLTSNLSPNALASHLGERLADRIREDASVVQVGGTTLRRAGKISGEGR
jgi:DNA replication protein DnaC